MRHLRGLPTIRETADAPEAIAAVEDEDDGREWWECYTADRWWL